jgi:hypothetical protein
VTGKSAGRTWAERDDTGKAFPDSSLAATAGPSEVLNRRAALVLPVAVATKARAVEDHRAKYKAEDLDDPADHDNDPCGDEELEDS